MSQAAVGLVLWAYPCLVSIGRARLNSNGLMLNGVVVAAWIGSVANKFYNFHEAMAEQTAIQMENGVGFWLGLVTSVVLIAGIVMIVRAAADQGAERVISED